MISCPNCNEINSNSFQICKKCGFILQDKITNLDFFQTCWMILESPIITFNKILRAEHKNFVILLFYGLISTIIFIITWFNASGKNFDNLIYYLLLIQLISIVTFLPLGFVCALLIYLTSKIFQSKNSFINCYAITGWSSMPLFFYFVIFVPIGLGIEGISFVSSFTSNITSNSILFYGISIIFITYFFILLIIGISSLFGSVGYVKFVKSFIIALMSLSITIFIAVKILNQII